MELSRLKLHGGEDCEFGNFGAVPQAQSLIDYRLLDEK